MKPRWAATLLALVFAFALLLGSAPTASAATSGGVDEPPTSITVAAAADLRPAFEELGRRFTTKTGVQVVLTFGSSGMLHEQIRNGAPFDLFASADVEYVDAVLRAGRGDRSTKATYAYGRLALVAPTDRAVPRRVGDLAEPRFARISIANPEHAPYGKAAEDALRRTGVRGRVKDRLVFGENVSDAMRIVKSGNADAGIVALSLAIADGGPYVLVPARLHRALEQALVVTATDRARGRAAEAFAGFVGSREGRRVMVRYGFVLPGEHLPRP